MEKDNKYYGLIENIVRNNRKFPGCEAVLDEIIDDVYSHSEVIINSIQNESVVRAYIEKVVTTSLITVARRYNIGKNRVAPIREISNTAGYAPSPAPAPVPTVAEPRQEVAEITPETVETLNEPELHEEFRANNAYVDDMINSIASDSVAESEQEEIVFDDNDEVLVEELEEPETLQSMEETISEEMEPVSEDVPVQIDAVEEIQDDKIFSELEESSNEDSFELEQNVEPFNAFDSVEESSTEEVLGDSDESVPEETIEETSELEQEEVQELNEQIEESEYDSPVQVDSFDFDEESPTEQVLGTLDGSVQEETIDEVSDFEQEEVQELTEPEELEYDNSVQDDSFDLAEESPAAEDIFEVSDESVQTEVMEEAAAIEEETLCESEGSDTDALDLTSAEPEAITEDVFADSEQEDMSLAEIEDITAEEEMVIPEENTELAMETGDVFELSDETEITEIEPDFQNDDLAISEDVSDDFGLTVDSTDSLVLDGGIEEVSLQPQEELLDTTEVHAESIEQKEPALEFHPLNYSAFTDAISQSPIMENVGNESISEQLLRLNGEYPNLKILSVFECKYKKNMSVDDISAALGMEKDEVIQALNELVGIV